MRRSLAVALVAALAAAGAAAIAHGTPSSTARILFWSGRGGFPGVWWMGADGSAPRLLTRFPENAKRGSLSPDGRLLVFDGAPAGTPAMTNFDVQLMRVDGTGRRRLTTSPIRELDATWSPDGKTISYTRTLDSDGRRSSIWLVRPDGTHKRRVTTGTEARWSPDGSKLLFARFDAHDRLNLFVLDLRTKKERRLTHSPGYDEPGGWSPDGSTIVFTREAANADVYRIGADGSGLRRLTSGPSDDVACCYSPDGRSIAFTSNRSGRDQVWTMRGDGSAARNVSRSRSDDEATQWHR